MMVPGNLTCLARETGTDSESLRDIFDDLKKKVDR